MNKPILERIKSLPSKPREMGFFVNGKFIPAGERPVFERRSPAHDVPVTRIPQCTVEDLNSAVQAARTSFEDGRWSGLPGSERASVLLKAAQILKSRRDEIAYWETLENGKAISQSRGEVDGGISCFEVGAGAARLLHGDSFNNLGEALLGVVTREPIGVVGLITPWNFPFLILCERVPFILASGCTMVTKPSEVTSMTTLLLAEVLKEAGLPDGVFNVITGPGRTIGQALTEHKDVDMLSFTGSTNVGRSCVHAAADSNFKKLGLELGGKNPIVVFADADLEDAADGVAFGIAYNTGQCCVSGSRLIVERSIASKFEKMVAEKLSRVRVGDPLDEQTQIGAITTDAQNRVILDYLQRGKAEGAQVVLGGSAIERGAGQFIALTLLSGVTSTMSVATDEIFGPVLVSMHFDTLEEAVQIANDTQYGLAATVWSKNIDKALTAIRKIKAGRCWVNTTLAGGPEAPIGGFKQSGWGRETGMYGVEEYTQVKSIHVAIGKRSPWVD
jgi:acyl-CoA reductase-like NAD-dependent aldehyde dehydrogenase